MDLRPLKTSENVGAIFINDKYQDDMHPLLLSENDIKTHQYSIEFYTIQNDKIKILFHSLEELEQFSKTYNLK